MKMVYVCKKCNKQWCDEENTSNKHCSCGGELYATGIAKDEWDNKTTDEKNSSINAWNKAWGNGLTCEKAEGDGKFYQEKNIGDEVKTGALILLVIELIGTIILTFAEGWIFLIIGIIVTAFITILLYAFGELVSRTISTNKIMIRMWEKENL